MSSQILKSWILVLRDKKTVIQKRLLEKSDKSLLDLAKSLQKMYPLDSLLILCLTHDKDLWVENEKQFFIRIQQEILECQKSVKDRDSK